MECIWTGFVIGCLSFAHCLGMCGGFALHLSGGGRAAVLGRQLLWHAGKTVSYMFLGAVAAFAGGQLVLAHGPAVQKALTWLAGGMMILAGMAMLGVRLVRSPAVRRSSVCSPTVRASSSAPQDALTGGLRTDGLLVGFLRQFFSRGDWRGALAMGLATGLLPCGIVYTALALSLQSGSVGVGIATMAAMGVGTAWSLLIVGFAGGAITARVRRWGAPIGGIVLLLLGAVTALRGTSVLCAILPEARPTMRDPSAAGGSAETTNTRHSCCEAASQP